MKTKEKLFGIYFEKQFSPPKRIGKPDESIEEISVFPVYGGKDCFIDVKYVNKKSLITISYEGKEWSGTMKQLINKIHGTNNK